MSKVVWLSKFCNCRRVATVVVATATDRDRPRPTVTDRGVETAAHDNHSAILLQRGSALQIIKYFGILQSSGK